MSSWHHNFVLILLEFVVKLLHYVEFYCHCFTSQSSFTGGFQRFCSLCIMYVCVQLRKEMDWNNLKYTSEENIVTSNVSIWDFIQQVRSTLELWASVSLVRLPVHSCSFTDLKPEAPCLSCCSDHLIPRSLSQGVSEHRSWAPLGPASVHGGYLLKFSAKSPPVSHQSHTSLSASHCFFCWDFPWFECGATLNYLVYFSCLHQCVVGLWPPLGAQCVSALAAF